MARKAAPKPLTGADSLTTGEAEQYSGLSRRQLHRLVANGRLTKTYIGQRIRWDRRELDALLSRTKAGAA